MISQGTATAWIAFPGGELEGKRPKSMCPACRERANKTGTLCFQCYRVELDRERALKAAANLDTASESRFQSALPFEPVDRPRLDRLRVERGVARAALQAGANRFIDKQRRAQISARHALERIAIGASTRPTTTVKINAVGIDAAIHAAELQLPEAWLPFVVSRA
jgi:hypothetical protein